MALASNGAMARRRVGGGVRLGDYATRRTKKSEEEEERRESQATSKGRDEGGSTGVESTIVPRHVVQSINQSNFV